MKTIKFELYLTNDAGLLQKCKQEIKNRFDKQLSILIDVPDKNEFSDNYLLKLKISPSEIWDTARKLAQIEGVIDVDPDLTASLNKAYQDLFQHEQADVKTEQPRPDPKWYHANTKFGEALQYATEEFKNGRGCYDENSTKIAIAHFDTGYTNHPEIALVDKARGHDYIASWYRRILQPNWRNDARDRLRNLRPILWASHGTSTASTIIGTTIPDPGKITGPDTDLNNGLWPEHVDLIPFRISENIISFNNKMVDATNQVINSGNIKIITMSHASLFNQRAWKNAVEKAYEKGIIWVAAAGSHAYGKLRSIIVFPAKYKETIATAASTHNDVPWERTHYGEEVDISAPGFDIYVPYSRRRWYGLMPNRYFYKWSEGTSFSTPITAAAAALWLAHHGEAKLNSMYPEPWQRIEAFRKVMKESARPHKPGIEPNKYGAGILDVLELVKRDLPDKSLLVRASDQTKQIAGITDGKQKAAHITHKEIVYLLGSAKIHDQDKDNDSLFTWVYANASGEARKRIDEITQSQTVVSEPNPKSEALKKFAKEHLNTWS